MFVVFSFDPLSMSAPSKCPLLALKPSKAEFEAWCATQRNLTSASERTARLVSSLHAITSLLAEARALSVTQEDMAALLLGLTEDAEIIQAHLDAVAAQAV